MIFRGKNRRKMDRINNKSIMMFIQTQLSLQSFVCMLMLSKYAHLAPVCILKQSYYRAVLKITQASMVRMLPPLLKLPIMNLLRVMSEGRCRREEQGTRAARAAPRRRSPCTPPPSGASRPRTRTWTGPCRRSTRACHTARSGSRSKSAERL
jgi:hypothetical protein